MQWHVFWVLSDDHSCLSLVSVLSTNARWCGCALAAGVVIVVSRASRAAYVAAHGNPSPAGAAPAA
jgi:hypothetical protein